MRSLAGMDRCTRGAMTGRSRRAGHSLHLAPAGEARPTGVAAGKVASYRRIDASRARSLRLPMTHAQTAAPTPRELRLWPGVSVAVLIVLVRFVVPVFVPEAAMGGVLGAVLGALLIAVWWLFFSRAPWVERLGAIAMMAVALIATRPLLHASIAGAGMGMLIYMLAIPVMSLALVAWAVASRSLRDGPKRASMAAAILLACGSFTLVRTGGIDGEGTSDLHWRWTRSPEERLLSRDGDGIDSLASPPSAPTPGKVAEWPGFRGAGRDGVIRGVRIETDWSRTPPVQLWRQPVGPGWSSFAADGDLLYTQEQRGDDEIVACYRVSTGEPVWRHRDAVRFWESNAGAGPRGTPSLAGGRVYTLGGTGILNVLDAGTGALVWSRNAASDGKKEVPQWGFAGSPLVLESLVVAAVAGKLLAYDRATGEPRWSGPDHGGSYSSPHLATIDGVAQVLLMSDAGTTSVSPDTGTVLWEHAWSGGGIVQPALTADGSVLIHTLAMTG